MDVSFKSLTSWFVGKWKLSISLSSSVATMPHKVTDISNTLSAILTIMVCGEQKLDKIFFNFIYFTFIFYFLFLFQCVPVQLLEDLAGAAILAQPEPEAAQLQLRLEPQPLVLRLHQHRQRRVVEILHTSILRKIKCIGTSVEFQI